MSLDHRKPPVDVARAERVAASLRENLLKRKAQQRAREQETEHSETPASPQNGVQQADS